MQKSFIWPLINRISHLLLILFFLITYILSDFDKLAFYHGAFGILIGVVFLFRVIWGFIGPQYSLFKDFDFSFKSLGVYLLSVIGKRGEYIGHNPASSFAIVAMIGLSFLAILTGLALFGVKEDAGLFSFLASNFAESKRTFKEIHEVCANLFVAVIIAHVAGALIEKFIKKGDGIDSMISGYKQTQTQIDIKLSFLQKLFSLIWIGGMIFSIYYFVFVANNILLG